MKYRRAHTHTCHRCTPLTAGPSTHTNKITHTLVQMKSCTCTLFLILACTNNIDSSNTPPALRDLNKAVLLLSPMEACIWLHASTWEDTHMNRERSTPIISLTSEIRNQSLFGPQRVESRSVHPASLSSATALHRYLLRRNHSPFCFSTFEMMHIGIDTTRNMIFEKIQIGTRTNFNFYE